MPNENTPDNRRVAVPEIMGLGTALVLSSGLWALLVIVARLLSH